MGEFKVIYNYVLQNNVRYMYSGLLLLLRYRGSGDYLNFDMFRINRENLDLKKLVFQFYEYQWCMNMFLIFKVLVFWKYINYVVDFVVDCFLKLIIV